VPGKSSSRRKTKAHRAERSDYFQTVVPYMSPRDADAAFRAWLAEVGLTRDELSSKDLAVEDRDGEGGRKRTYRVYRYAIPDRT